METSRCIFNDDPEYMKSLIGKSVEVTTTYNHTYKGIVYVIDPDSKTLVLAIPQSDAVHFDMELILYHSITSFKTLSNDTIVSEFLFENEVPTLTEELEEKKKRLKRWLQQNLLDVSEEGDQLIIGKACIIEYPYGPEQCLCDNIVILERTRALIERMPNDFV